jgi:hypothetical protein
MLACEADKPVLPVIMEGTLETLPRDSWVFTLERKIYPVLRVLEPIEPRDHGHDPERLSAAVREVMVAGIAQLRADIDARGGLEVRPRSLR